MVPLLVNISHAGITLNFYSTSPMQAAESIKHGSLHIQQFNKFQVCIAWEAQ